MKGCQLEGASSDSTLFRQECFRCRAQFEFKLPLSVEGHWAWGYPRIYCDHCQSIWSEAWKDLIVGEFRRSLDSAEMAASRGGVATTVEDLLTLVPVPGLDLPAVFAQAGLEVVPRDWYHSYLGRVTEALFLRRLSPVDTGKLLFRLTGAGEWTVWKETALTEESTLIELLDFGAIEQVVHAFKPDERAADPRKLKLCEHARQRLKRADPKVRFEALWVLMILDKDNSLTDFLESAANVDEHPRIRGLALEGLQEVIGDSARGPEVRKILRLVKHLLSDPQPEVRWWACYVVSRIWPFRPLRGRRVAYRSNRELLERLQQLKSDDIPAGLGWSVGKAAADAIENLQGRDIPDRPTYCPYDPWGVI